MPTPSPTELIQFSPSPSQNADFTPTPNPNANSSPEPSIYATPAPMPTIAPSPSIEPTFSPTPEVTFSPSPDAIIFPLPTPEIIISPSAIPFVSPNVSVTFEPSPLPSIIPSPTPEIIISPSPDVSISPSPTIDANYSHANESELNISIPLNDTNTTSILNLTNSTIDANLSNTTLILDDDAVNLEILRGKFSKNSKISFKSLKKRVRENNGTNETIFDLEISIKSAFKRNIRAFGKDIDSEPESSISIKGLKDPSMLNSIFLTAPAKIDLEKSDSSNTVAALTTDFIGFEPLEFDEAQIILPSSSKTEKILICEGIDGITGECSNWHISETPFIESDGSVTFSVDHFSGYAGANITILNLQSFPVVGSNWTVRFTTNGSAPLTITAIDNTSFGTDLEFKFLKCGETDLSPTFNGTSVFMDNYSCVFEGSEESIVHTLGKHRLEFRFGDAVAYANNYASLLRWYFSNLTSDLSGFRKRLNVTSPGEDTALYNESVVISDGTYFSTSWYSPHFNVTSFGEKTYVSGIYRVSARLGQGSGVAGSYTVYAEIMKYNQSGSYLTISTANLGTNFNCLSAGETKAVNVTIPRSENTTLLPGERIGTRFLLVTESCSFSVDFELFYNRSDTFMDFYNETVGTCENLTSSFTLGYPANATGNCYNILSNNIVLDCGGNAVIGNGSGMGVNVTGKSNVTVKNCIISNFSDGIFVNNSLNFTLINTTIYKSPNDLRLANSPFANISSNSFYGNGSGLGLNATNSSNLTIRSSYFYSCPTCAYLNGSNNLTILHTVFTNGTTSLDLQNGQIASLLNTTIRNYIKTGTAISLNIFDNLTLQNSSIANYTTGFSGTGSSNISIRNTNFSNTTTAISLDSASDGLIDSSTFLNSPRAGTAISLASFENMTVQNSSIANFSTGITEDSFSGFNLLTTNISNSTNGLLITGSYGLVKSNFFYGNSLGLRISTGNYIKIYSNIFENNTGIGVEITAPFTSAQFNLIENNTFRNNSPTNLIVSGSIATAPTVSGNNFTNNIFYASPLGYDINISGSQSNTFLNNTFNRSLLGYSTANGVINNLTLQNYIRANVTGQNGFPLQGALVNITNSTLGATNFTGLVTGTEGLTDFEAVAEFIGNNTVNTTLTYYNISGSYGGIVNSTLASVNESKSVLLVIPATGCSTISSPTTLVSDVVASGNCFVFGQNSVSLDCNGHSITGAGSGNGVNLNSNINLVVKNCVISNFSNGITGSDIRNLTLINSTLHTNAKGATFNGINGSKFYTTVFENNTNTGLELTNSFDYMAYNEVENNTFRNNTAQNLLISIATTGSEPFSTGNNFTSNIFVSSQNGNDIRLVKSQSNYFVNNTFDRSRLSYGAGINNLTIQNYLRIQVVDQLFNPIPGALANITNGQFPNATNYTGLVTDSSGLTSFVLVTEFIGSNLGNSTNAISNLTYYNFSASYGGVSNRTLHPVNASNTVLVIIPLIAGCGNIASSGSLSASISTTGTCLNITADSVEIDCRGYTISGNNAAGMAGINVTGRSNVLVRNCIISKFEHGILVSKSINFTLINTTLSQNGNGLMAAGSNFTNISASTFFGNGTGLGINASQSHNLTVGYTIFTSNKVSINLNASVNFSISNSEQNNASNGTRLVYSNYSIFVNDTFIGRGVGFGINATSSSNVSVLQSTFINFTYAFFASDSSNLTIFNSTILNSSAGINLNSSFAGIVSNVTLSGTASGTAISLNGFTNFSIIFSTISNYSIGILARSNSNFFYLFNSSIRNVPTGTTYGIYFDTGNTGNITRAFIQGKRTGTGFYSYNFQKITVLDSEFMNLSSALYLSSSTGLFLNNSNISDTVNNGLELDAYTSSNVSHNLLYRNLKGIVLGAQFSSSTNLFKYNILENNTNFGFELDGDNGNKIISNTVENNTFRNNTISNLYFYSTTGTFPNNVDNNFTSNVFIPAPNGYDINLSRICCNTFLNNSFNRSRIGFASNASLTIQNYIQVQAVNSTLDPIPGAYVNITNSTSGATNFNDLATDGQGLTVISAVTEFIGNNSVNTTLTLYNFSAAFSDIYNTSLHEVNYSRIVTLILRDTFAPSNIIAIPPTPANASYTSNNWVNISFNFTETNPNNCILQWGNGTLQNLSMTRDGNNCNINVSSQPDGTHNYTIIVNDSAGNIAQNGTFYVTIDTALPSTIRTVPPTPANASYTSNNWVNISFNFTETNPNNCILQWGNGTLQNLSMTRDGNNCNINVSSQPDGTHNYTIIVNDSAGNIAQNGTFYITIDTVLPTTIRTVSPTLANASFTPNNWTFVNFTFTETNPGNCLLSWGNGTLQNLTMTRDGNSCYLNVTRQPDGTHNYTIIVNDSAGNFAQNGTFYVTIDTAVPTTIRTVFPTLANASYTANTWVFVNATFTETNPNNCLLQWGNGSFQNLTMIRSGNSCYLNVTLQPDGVHNYTIIVNDSAGNMATNGTFYITIDLTPPSSLQPISPTLTNNSNTSNTWIYVNFTFTELNPSACWVQWYNGTYQNLTMSRAGNNCSINITNQPDGQWNYDLFVNDSAGNVGSNRSFFVNIDSNAPTNIRTVSPTLANASFTNRNWVYVNTTFTETFPHTCNLQWNNGSFVNITMSREGTNCYYNLTNQPDGRWNYTIIVNDTTNNYGQNGTFFVTVDTTIPSSLNILPPTPANNSNLSRNWVNITYSFIETNFNSCFVQWVNSSGYSNLTASRVGNNCSINITSQPQGNWNYTVFVNDSAGNIGQNGTFFVSLDTALPSQLQFVLPTPSNNSRIYGDWVFANATFSEANPETCTLVWNNGTAHNLTMDRVSSNCFLNLTNQPLGAWNYTLVVNDSAGNSAQNGTFFLEFWANTTVNHLSANQTYTKNGIANITVIFSRTSFANFTNDADAIQFASGNGTNITINSGNVSLNFTDQSSNTSYFASGIFERTIDAGYANAHWKISWNSTVPINSSLAIQAAVSADNSTFSPFENLSNSTLSIINGTPARYLKYRLLFGSNGSVTAFLNEINATAMYGINGNATFNLTNRITNATLTKSCIAMDGNCTIGFAFPSELRGGNYSINITASNISAFLDSSSEIFYSYFEEAITNGSILVPDRTISNLNASGQIFLMNVSLENKLNGTMHFPAINFTTKSSSITSIARISSSCGPMVSPFGNCNATFNLSISGSATPGTHTITWNASWTNNNGTNYTIANRSNVIVSSNPALSTSVSIINISSNLSQTNSTTVTVTNIGNIQIFNITASLIAGNIPPSWISLSPLIDPGQSPSFTYDLQVDVLIGNYTPATYIGKINLTADDQTNGKNSTSTYIDLQIQVNPQINSSPAAVTANISLTNNQSISTTISNPGNAPITNVSVSVINSTIPSSWISFNSPSSGWNSSSISWTSISEGSGAVLQIIINVLDFIAGIFSALVKITSNEGRATYINVTVNVSPGISIQPLLNLTTGHGKVNITSFLINSTGNIKLVNLTVSFISGTIPQNWISLSPSTIPNITEGVNYSVYLNVSVPFGQLPGNYTGIINISGYNANGTLNLTVHVPTDTSWHFLPGANQTKDFGLSESGVVGTITINNTGNANHSFTIGYADFGGRASCIGGPPSGQDFCGAGQGIPANPSTVSAPKNSSTSFTIMKTSVGDTNITDGYAVQISMSNSTALPTSNSTILFFNITNAPPKFSQNATFVGNALRTYVEFNGTIKLSAIATDDELWGLNLDYAQFNISRPDGTNNTLNATNQTLNTAQICGGACLDAQNYTYPFNMTNVTGIYNATFFIRDRSSQLNSTSIQFEVIGNTSLLLLGNSTNVSGITNAANYSLILNISTNNTGLVSAYSINLSGMLARASNATDTLANWSFNAIPTIPYLNGSSINLTQFNITIAPRSYGIYYFTPNASFRNPNGTIAHIWGQNITITALQNANFSISISNQSISLQHGQNQSEWLEISPNGNDNITNYNITYSTPFANFSVNFNNTQGNISALGSANISFNISTLYHSSSGFRNFTINITAGAISRTFVVNLTIPYNNTWGLNLNNITINGIAGDSSINSQAQITHSGTSDALLNFTFNLTGNMTSFSNLLNQSKYLNSSQSFAVPINYTVPDSNSQYMGVLNISEGNGSIARLVNITFNSFTVEVHVHAIYAPSQVLAGDPINITARLVFGGQNQTINTTWSVFGDGSACAIFSNSTSGNFTNLNCTAPSLTDATYHNITVKANFTNGNVFLAKNITNASAIFYRDITPPRMISEDSNDTELYSNTTLVLNATDNFQPANATAILTFPNGTASNFSLPFNSTRQLFIGSYNFTSLGLHTINYAANDTTGNSNSSLNGSFEIYQTRQFNGSLQNLEGQFLFVNFSIRNSTDGNLDNFTTNATGHYNKSLRAKWYELGIKFLFYNATINSVDFNTINQGFITLDNFTGSDISSQIAGAKAGFAAIIQAPTNGSLVIDYAPLLSSITDESLLRIYQCANYTYASRTCVGSWDYLLNTTTNSISNIISANFSSFANNISAFALVQYVAPTPTPAPGGTTTTGGSSGGSSGSYNPPPATATPSATPKADNITAQLEELKKLLKENKTESIGLEPGVSSLTFELYPGESTQSAIHIKNLLNISSEINVSMVGGIRPFITTGTKTIKLNRLHETDLLVFGSIPDGTRAGNFFGELQLANEIGRISIPVTVRVLEKKEDRLIDLRLQPLVDTLDPGETLRVELSLYNLGEPKEISGQFTLELVDPVTDEILSKSETESISFQTTYNSIRAVKIPRETRNGRFVVRGILLYSVEGGKLREVSAISYFKVQASIWSSKLFGTLSLWQLLPILLILAASFITYYRQYQIAQKKRRYIARVDFTKLPEPGPRSGFLGLIAESKVRAFASLDKLQTHVLIAGATGSGKTVAAQVIAEEALMKNISVLIFDPTAQWTGFLRPQKNRDMLSQYKHYGLNTDSARAFKGNIFVVRDPNLPIDIRKVAKPGEATIFVMNKLSFADHETFVANTIKQVFAAGLTESPELKLLLVYDEVHRLLPKFGGRGEGFIQIERGAREFRKWGVGMVLISQVLSDFVGEIKANIGTEIQMRTKYEGDLERLKLKFGEDAARSIVKESIGSGMVQNSEYNNGQPYFVSFRPLLHNIVRLSDTELSQYEEYNTKVEKLEFEMEKLRSQGEDVLDLELEINLARDKVKKGAFNIVEIYLESLEQKIEGMKRKSKRKPDRMIDFSDLGIGSLGGEIRRESNASGEPATTNNTKAEKDEDKDKPIKLGLADISKPQKDDAGLESRKDDKNKDIA